MKIKTQRQMGLFIMTVGLVIGAYAIITNFNELYDASILIFLIGIVINDWGVYRLLGIYESLYGKIDE